MLKLSKPFAALALLTAGCGTRPAPEALIACVPPGTIAVAGIDLDRIRQAPVYDGLPSDVHTLADTYRNAHRMLLAWNGEGLLIVVRGAMPGGTAVAPGLVATGPAEAIRAATDQYRTGKPGVPALIDYAMRTSGSSPIWAAAQGGVDLPVSGNARNLNRLFRNLSYAALTADLTDSILLRIAAQGRTGQDAREFEESLRAFLTLAAAAAQSRNPQLATLLKSAQITRNAATVTTQITLSPSLLAALLQPLAHTF